MFKKADHNSCKSEHSMRTTQRLGVTPPTLTAHDRAMEHWLLQEVGPAYDALKADPARALSIDQVRSRLAALHKKAGANR